MLLLILAYGALAFLREIIAIKYYNSVYAGRAFWVMVQNFMIGGLDSLAIVWVFERIVNGWGIKAIIPLITYELCGSLGAYIGVKRSGRYRDL